MTRFHLRAILVLPALLVSATIGLAAAPQGDTLRPQRPELEASDPLRRDAALDPRDTVNADRTRQALNRLLERHPPSVGRILKLDPTLMRNEDYLKTYPALQRFLAENPDVQQNVDYYFASIFTDHYQPRTREQQLVEATLAGLAALVGVAVVLSTLVWLVRTSLDHRRWNRLSRIQAEVHTKLMDRFSSNEELLAYVQTPSGRRFLESGPSPQQEPGQEVPAPVSRILWSVQVGSVLLVSGLGLLFLSSRVMPEARDFFYIAGCLAAAAGAGFVVSAVAAYVLSWRLGLLDRGARSHA